MTAFREIRGVQRHRKDELQRLRFLDRAVHDR
jgi:hypothetical protein